MKIRDTLKDGTPLVLMMCKCSIWPMSTFRPGGRCGECHSPVKHLPDYDKIDYYGRPL